MKLARFELWDMLGVKETVAMMEAHDLSVPAWVQDMLSAGKETFYHYEDGRAVGYYDPASQAYKAIEGDPRKIIIDDLRTAGKELERNGSASILDMGDGVLLLEFHAKMNAIDDDMIKMMNKARAMLDDDDMTGLVIGNQGENFCVGANLFPIAMGAQQNMFDQIDTVVKALQDALMAFRYSPKPVGCCPVWHDVGWWR